VSDTKPSEACPFCGAKLWAMVSGLPVFECGNDNVAGTRGEGCFRGEIERLKAELEKAKEARNRIAHETRAPLLIGIETLRARIKRLEAAGDALIGVLRDTEDQDFCDWVDKARDAETAWTAAKEATP